jgi:serine/threonine protein phosphatase PrpC
MASVPPFTTAIMSDPGLVRKNNEDAVDEDLSLGLVVLADGMGGHSAGEVASGIAVAGIIEHVHQEWSQRVARFGSEGVYSAEAELLREALELANLTIFQAAQAQPQYAGMGTTAIACLLHDDRVHIAHVGDSRVYRMRDGVLEQITRDHSVIEELVTKAGYSREVAQEMVSRNQITRALGAQSDLEVDLIEELAEPGDLLLICSDGLSDMIDDNAIAHYLRDFGDHPDRAAAELIAAANGAGGRDNVSVVLIRINRTFSRGRKWFKRLLQWF